MKRMISLALLAALLWTCRMAAAGQDTPLLYTCYRQMGWGDSVQIGWIDREGGLWLLTGHDSSLRWPYKTEEQLAYLRSCRDAVRMGTLTREDLFDLRGMAASVQAREVRPVGAACDAGTERSYAVKEDGTCVLLGMSGDDMYENTDPTAQALYWTLRQLFPQVRCYGGTMGPAGFQPVSVASFCGYDPDKIPGSAVTAVHMDCEAGAVPLELDENAADRLRQLAVHGTVTGKANCTMVTGGTTCVCFSDSQGNPIASLEFYEGLLVRGDGMYRLK